MKLSIITINFNNATGLYKTIESVIKQTSNDIEYILIDGGSTDGSVEVIKAFEDKISYWISEPDNGIYQAMNKGIKAAKGDYCQFLNSGDCLVQEDVTERMLYRMPETSVLIGNMLKILPNGKCIIDNGISNKQPTFFTFYRGTLNHSPAYIRRSLFEKYGYYDESLKIVSDWKWYLIVIGLHNEEVVYKDINVSLFDMNGISNSSKELLKTERRLVLEAIVPSNILVDYDRYGTGIIQMNRIKNYTVTKFLFEFVERTIFYIEKIKSLF